MLKHTLLMLIGIISVAWMHAYAGTLWISTDPAGAEIFVNGQASGETPNDPDYALRLMLPEGEHRIEARKPDTMHYDYVAAPKSILVTSGHSQWVRLNLERTLRPEWQTLQDQLSRQDLQQGTATDFTTGLVWMRCSQGQRWTGERCSGEARAVSWTEAQHSLDALNRQSGHAGHNDWRLPNQDELNTLVVCAMDLRGTLNADGSGGACQRTWQQPTLDQRVFPDTPVGIFWTATRDSTSAVSAAYVGFDDGYVGYTAITDLGYVRSSRLSID